jgi:proprotein convertase subtilisin/kexin type 1
VVRTSSPQPLLGGNPGWKTNAAGLAYNTKFGFGVMNALALVRAAIGWKGVGEQLTAQVNASEQSNTTLRSQDAVLAQFEVPSSPAVKYLEHVEAMVTIEYPVRGALEVLLLSPSGTMSQLLTARPEDKSNEGFKQWKFMSVHFWGEDPSGTWKLYVVDKVSRTKFVRTASNGNSPQTSKELLVGSVSDLRLFLYGTAEDNDMPVAISRKRHAVDAEWNELAGKRK